MLFFLSFLSSGASLSLFIFLSISIDLKRAKNKREMAIFFSLLLLLSLSPIALGIAETRKCALIQNSWKETFSSFHFKRNISKNQPIVYLVPDLPKGLREKLSLHYSILDLDPSRSVRSSSSSHSPQSSSSQSPSSSSISIPNPTIEKLVHLFLYNRTRIKKGKYKIFSPTEYETLFIQELPSLLSSFFSYDILVGPLASTLAPFFLWFNPNARVILLQEERSDNVDLWRRELAASRLLVGFEPIINNKTLSYMAWQVSAVMRSLILCLFPENSLFSVQEEKRDWCIVRGGKSSGKTELKLPFCSSFSHLPFEVCPWVKGSWERVMSQHFTEDSSSRMGVIIVGSEGTTATKYLHQMSQKLGFLAQHYRKGIEPQLFKLLNENHYNNHQTLLELLRGLEERDFLSDTPIPILTPLLLWRNSLAKLILSWRPFNDWIFHRIKDHTYRSQDVEISGSPQRVNPYHPRPPIWISYAGHFLFLSCLRSGSQLMEVRLFENPKTSESEIKEFMVKNIVRRRGGRREKREREKSENLKIRERISSHSKTQITSHYFWEDWIPQILRK